MLGTERRIRLRLYDSGDIFFVKREGRLFGGGEGDGGLGECDLRSRITQSESAESAGGLVESFVEEI